MSYTQSGGILGKGFQIGYSTTSTGTFTNIGECLVGNMPKQEANIITPTNHDSPAGCEEIAVGLMKGGDLSITFHYLTAQTATLYSQVGVKQYWRVSLPDGTAGALHTTVTFAGILKELDGGEFNGENPTKYVESKGTLAVQLPLTFGTVGA